MGMWTSPCEADLSGVCYTLLCVPRVGCRMTAVPFSPIRFAFGDKFVLIVFVLVYNWT